jgi:hypothetical protein
VRRVRATVALHILSLLGRRQGGGLGRVDTHDDDLEVFARGQVHHLERAHQAIQIFGAQDLALVVDQREDHGFLAEVVSQLDGLASLVAKRSIQRQGLAQPLLDLDGVENVRQTILGRIAHGLLAVGSYLGPRGGCGSQEQ